MTTPRPRTEAERHANRLRNFKFDAERRMQMFDLLSLQARNRLNYKPTPSSLSTIRRALQNEGKWPK